MIFRSEIISVEEDRAHIKFTHGQDIGPHLAMCHELRTHDEQNGMSAGRQFQHVASIPEIEFMRILCERPEIIRDGKEMSKWLRSDGAQRWRVSRDAVPIRGDSLQLIIR